MKANELMVGDWYYSIATTNERAAFQFEAIDWLEGFSEECDAKPIPLTDEILEKNGFSTTDEKYYYIEETENKFGYSFAIRRNRTGLFCIVCDQVVILEYVHQIQHLLRLCGFNDMANNIKVE